MQAWEQMQMTPDALLHTLSASLLEALDERLQAGLISLLKPVAAALDSHGAPGTGCANPWTIVQLCV